MYLNLPTLKYRPLRGDVIEVFKITHNISDTTVSPDLPFNERTPEATTINCKIIVFIMTYEGIFSARIVNIWKSLPNSVFDACTVNAFEAHLR